MKTKKTAIEAKAVIIEKAWISTAAPPHIYFAYEEMKARMLTKMIARSMPADAKRFEMDLLLVPLET